MKQNMMLVVWGGNDGEAVVTRQLCALAGVAFAQPNAGWGTHLYSPADLGLEVCPEGVEPTGSGAGGPVTQRKPATLKDDLQVVFCECKPAADWPAGSPAILVDHHGDRAGEPASILQLLALLEARGFRISDPTRRWVELVAANDAAYIPGMLALGATPEEVDRIRLLDRNAQGITPEQEAEGLRAIAEKEVNGRLTVVRMSHSKTATVADRLYGQYDQLLILSGDGEANFYGDGALCAALQQKFEGWSGGSGLGTKGANAYWGGYPNHEDLLQFVTEALAS